MNLSKNKVIGGVVGLLAIVSIVNTQAILKLTNFITGDSSSGVSLDGSKQSAQVVNFSTKITEGQTYKRGDKSVDVQKVQQALTTQGIYKGAVSGTFGPQTERAVMDFQTKNGLRATGILDTNTINLILRGGGRPSPGFETAQCNSNTQPWIRVISPNGGEVYQAGQQVNVAWTSCNIPTNSPMFVTLQGDNVVDSAFVFPDPIPGNNSGTYVATLPTQNTWSQMVYGLHYKILVGTYYTSNINASDESDNFFSIVEGGGDGEGLACAKAWPIDDYNRVITPGSGDNAISKFRIRNACGEAITLNSVQYTLASSRHQKVINSVDLWLVEDGNLIPLSATTEFPNLVQNNFDRDLNFSLGNNNIVIPANGEIIVQMQGKAQQYSYYNDTNNTFTIGIKRIRYTKEDGFIDHTYPWVWNERSVIMNMLQ